MMRKLLFTALLLLLPGAAYAQSCNGQFAAGQVCGNPNSTQGLPSAGLLSPLLDRNFGAPSAKGTVLNRGTSLWLATINPVIGNPGTTTGTLGLGSVSGGTATLTPPAVAGDTALQLPSLAGTVPSTAVSPIVLDATTGALSCPTCVTGTSGALVINLTAVSGATAGKVLYSDGSKLQAYSITGTAGNAVLSISPSITTPAIAGGSITALTTLAVRDTSAAFDLTLAATSSPVLTAGHSLTFNVQNADRTLSMAGNVTFGGTFSSSSTVSITGAFSTAAAFSTAGAFTQAGAFATTLTSTNTTNSTLPAGTHTLAGLDVAQTWSALQQYNDSDFALKGATSGTLVLHAPAIAGSASITFPAGTTDFSATGGGVVQQASAGAAFTVGTVSNAFLANSSVTIGTTSIALGATSLTLAGVTSYNKVALTAPATGSTLTILDGKTATFNNSITVAGTDSTIWTGASTNMTLAALNIAGQTVTGGVHVTSSNLGTITTGTTTLDNGTRPTQFATNGGAFTLAADTTHDGSVAVELTNNGSAGTVTVSGTSGSCVGAAPDTTNGHKFLYVITTVNTHAYCSIIAGQ